MCVKGIYLYDIWNQGKKMKKGRENIVGSTNASRRREERENRR